MDTAELCIERHFTADRLNEIANHPSVRPALGGDGRSYLDFTAFLANPKNHALVWDHGSFIFDWSAPETYQVHMAVLPEGRGKAAYEMAREGIEYIVKRGAERLWARVGNDAHGLRHYTAQAGFTRCGTDTLDFDSGPVTYDLYQWKKPCRCP